ncbi:MAG: hypothetical protein KF859_13355 [Phycisphaeraceae bacterium]|nr:hypothetical protein [Phycisphaeraceae bacterium]
MNNPRRSLSQASAFLAAGFSAIAIAQPSGCVIIEQDSAVYALSSDGLRAAGLWLDVDNVMYIYTWGWGEGRCDQPWGEGIEWAVLVGMSADGTTVAGNVLPDDSQVNDGYAWHGEACGDMRTPGLDWLPGPRNYITEGLSGDGLTVYGTISDSGTTGAIGAFLWRPGTGEVIELDLMPQYWGRSITLLGSMNSDYAGDRIAGTLSDEDFFTRAAVWDEHGTGRLLPIATGHSLNSTAAHGISRNGRYIVGRNRASGVSYAAIWKDEQPPELVLLGLPTLSSGLRLIADHGRMGIGSHGQQIVAWTRENGPENLVTFLARHGAGLPDGWNVHDVSSISADGSVIAGNLRRTNPTRFQGFIAYTNYRPCFADFNSDGGVDGRDVEDFFLAWESGDLDGDVNQDGGTDGGDVERFFIDWETGGCGDS